MKNIFSFLLSLLLITHLTYPKKVLIVGSGGREHALCWKMAQSSQVDAIFVAPGNAGTAQCNKTQNITIAVDDVSALLNFAQKKQIDLTVVGPELPLTLGIVDTFNEHNLACFGPSREAAHIEASKKFAKDFMQHHNIPTAEYKTFIDAQKARDYIKQQSNYPIVVKADGLAAGKGVVIAQNQQVALNAIENMMQKQHFGHAGNTIVIEQFLRGREVSFFAICDGQAWVPLTTAQDYKKAYDNNFGPNTGGMGAISPAPIDAAMQQRIMREIIEPTVAGLAQDGIPYTGVLYAGLMITPEGDPYVLEFNCRFGDPETEPMMMRLKSDLYELCYASATQTLRGYNVDVDQQSAVGVVLASGGYPIAYKKGFSISGLERRGKDRNVMVFHAGTKMHDDEVVTNGGRVLCVTAVGSDIVDARKKAYGYAESIKWSGKCYRTDIGFN